MEPRQPGIVPVTVGLMDREELQDWIARYEQAWRAPGTESLRELFADDAGDRLAPYADPLNGLAAIARFWEENRQGPD